MAKFRKQVEGYEIHDPIGNPHESRVYKAKVVETDRPVALKALPLDFFQSDKEFQNFSELTAKATGLKHPNILMPEKVIGKFTEAYLVEELIEGPNLKDYVNAQAPDVPQVNRIALQLLNAIQYLHSKKLLHRNLKGSNVLVRPDKSVVTCDLFYSPLFARWRRQHGFSSVESVRFVSPEECQEKKLTVESDIYSLGVLLYFAYTRVMPIRGHSVGELQVRHVKQVVREKPEDINPAVSPYISEMLLKMLAKSPKRRYSELGELILDLRRMDGNASSPGTRARI